MAASFASFAVAAAGAWATWSYAVPYLTNHDYFRLRAIRISSDETRVAPETLAEIAGLYDGTSLWDVDPEAIVESLREASWVKSTSVSRHFPWQVSVTVSRRHAVAAAVAAGKPFLVDQEGALFQEVGETTLPDLPYLTGWDDAEAVPERGERLRSLLGVLAAANNRSVKVSELHMDDDGTVWLYGTGSKAAVRLGNADRAEVGLDRLAVALAELGPLADRARLIDTDYRDRIVIRGADDKLPALLAAHTEKALALSRDAAANEPASEPGNSTDPRTTRPAPNGDGDQKAPNNA